MQYPRVWTVKEGRLSLHPDWHGLDVSYADVLIVCGQGVYEDGIYHGEFHDRDVYFEHGMMFPMVARRFGYNCIVLSGGFTQKHAPWTSEAESLVRILNDSGHATDLPSHVPCILDELALDSAENLLFGLMTARLALGETSIRRVGIWAAWKFKKWRFNRNAQALGIVERTYFHGSAPASNTNIRVPPDDATQRTKDEYDNDTAEFSLLRAEKERAEKRAVRWQNNRVDTTRDVALGSVSLDTLTDLKLWKRDTDEEGAPVMKYKGMVCSSYSARLDPLRRFERTLQALRAIEEGSSVKDVPLARMFRDEVIL